MFQTTLKVATVLIVFALTAPSSFAVNKTMVQKSEQPIETNESFTKGASTESSQGCAMHLEGKAHEIYRDVSPDVEGDSNLRKLVKKNVRSKVFKGKLSIKEARYHAKAAATCLSLLKTEKQIPLKFNTLD